MKNMGTKINAVSALLLGFIAVEASANSFSQVPKGLSMNGNQKSITSGAYAPVYNGDFQVLITKQGVGIADGPDFHGVIGSDDLAAAGFYAYDSNDIFPTATLTPAGHEDRGYSVTAGNGSHSTSSVPEPGTALIIGCGSLCVAIYGKRKSAARG